MKLVTGYFSRVEIIIWTVSVIAITTSFLSFGEGSIISLIASVIGVTSLSLNAKGNPVGQALTIVFSVLYGAISFQSAYYGEMITYLGMTAPMAFVSMITWMRNMVSKDKMEVKVHRLQGNEITVMMLLAVIVTCFFYFVLRFFNTTNLIISTISVLTSFLAAYMTYKRSPYYAIGYALNDLVLIWMWILMIPYTRAASAMVICFIAFGVNDLYGFINWNRMYRQQYQ